MSWKIREWVCWPKRGHDLDVDQEVVLGGAAVVDGTDDAVDAANVIAARDVELAGRAEQEIGVGTELVGDEVEVDLVMVPGECPRVERYREP
jgi:hypothetical protein